MIYYLHSYTVSHFGKRFYSERKDLLKGTNFFRFREESFSEGSQNKYDRVASPESVSVPLK